MREVSISGMKTRSGKEKEAIVKNMKSDAGVEHAVESGATRHLGRGSVQIKTGKKGAWCRELSEENENKKVTSSKAKQT